MNWKFATEPVPAALQPVLLDPAAFLHDSRSQLQQSAASIVVRVPGGFVLKHFRRRKLLHASRPLREFRTARLLAAHAIPSVSVVAANRDYLITREITSSIPLGDCLVRMLARVAGLLAQLHNAGFSHSDLNLANFVVSPTGLFLVDLEGVKWHRRVTLRQAATDLRRLERRAVLSAEDWQVLLSEYCRQRRPPVDSQILGRQIQRGHREWEVRCVGGLRWRVRPRHLNKKLRLLLENPDTVVSPHYVVQKLPVAGAFPAVDTVIATAMRRKWGIRQYRYVIVAAQSK